MIEKTIKGIKYRLDEERLTAEVIAKRNGYEGDIIIPETVVFKKVAYRVTSIEEEAFLDGSSLTSMVIGNGVTSIGEKAFYYCSSLTSIVIGNGVTSIGDLAFLDCSSLTSITYNDTKAQWKGIKLGDDWNEGVPASVIHCTDGDIKNTKTYL